MEFSFGKLKEWMEERDVRVAWSWGAPESRQSKVRAGARVNSDKNINSRYFQSHSTKIRQIFDVVFNWKLSSKVWSGNCLLSGINVNKVVINICTLFPNRINSSLFQCKLSNITPSRIHRIADVRCHNLWSKIGQSSSFLQMD